MHQGQKCPAPIELLHIGLGNEPKGASPSLGGGVNAFFRSLSCWQSVKIHEDLVKLPGFQCIGGGSVPPPNELPDAGPGDALKGALPGLGGGVHAFFCLVSGLQCVGKRVAWIQ